MAETARPHLFSGLAPAAGDKVRACCTCGYRTSPRVSRVRARNALEADHGTSLPTCGLCGRTRWERDEIGRYTDVEVLTDDQVGDHMIVCRDAPSRCRDLAARRQVDLDRAVLGDATPPPTLRMIRNRHK